MQSGSASAWRAPTMGAPCLWAPMTGLWLPSTSGALSYPVAAPNLESPSDQIQPEWVQSIVIATVIQI